MQPIVLIPGFLCTAEVFSPQIAALWPFGPVTVASTLQGKTIAEIAASILASAPPSFALAGFSMGGYICLEIIRQAPERVKKLALLNSSAYPDSPEQIEQRRGWVDKINKTNFEFLMASAIKAALHPAHREDKELAEINLRMARVVGLEGFEQQTEAVISRKDSRPILQNIAVPTLVLTSDTDLLMPLEHSREMAETIPGARLVVIEKCGHDSTLEQPEAVNQALVEWITY